MAPPFNGLVVVASGTFPGYKQGIHHTDTYDTLIISISHHTSSMWLLWERKADLMALADLKAIVENGGGQFSTKVTDQCTHLVTTQEATGKAAKSGWSFALIYLFLCIPCFSLVIMPSMVLPCPRTRSFENTTFDICLAI
jgi:hypothetical protein